MSRKDYVALASAIRAEYESDYDGPVVRDLVRAGIRLSTEAIANVLESDNPSFNRERFMEAALGKDSK